MLNLMLIGGVILVAFSVFIWGLISILVSGREMDDRLEQYAVVREMTSARSTGQGRMEIRRIRLRANNLSADTGLCQPPQEQLPVLALSL